ncbi:hypothetical protein ACHAWX_005438 [Stephanocyclus meneghinianus]
MEEAHLPLAAQNNEANHDDNDNEEEEEHFRQVCRSYQQYATFHQTIQQGVNQRVRQLLAKAQLQEGGRKSSGPTMASIMPPSMMPDRVESRRQNAAFCEATVRNQFFLDSVLRYSGVMTSQEVLKEMQQNKNHRIIEWATEDQMSKVDSVLKSVARDWSAEGSDERRVVYDRMLIALDKYLPLDRREEMITDDGPPRISVPGSGLGRLAWEIHSRGYTVQGSDFSLPMLLASDFILNGCAIPENCNVSHDKEGTSANRWRQFKISPWLAETKNVTTFDNRIRTVTVPDVDPSSIQNVAGRFEVAPEFTMLAGEFLSLYSSFLPQNQVHHDVLDNNHPHQHPPVQKFHGIACSYFLDTAPSLPEYLITIYHMLVDGGLLLHFGPLMYHWSGHGALLPRDLVRASKNCIADTNSRYHKRNAVDFTWSEVRHMIVNTGFEMMEEEMNIPALYTANHDSMMKVLYNSVFLVLLFRMSNLPLFRMLLVDSRWRRSSQCWRANFFRCIRRFCHKINFTMIVWTIITHKFHVIECSFFPDTASSPPEQLLTIYHMLVDGGLLLHFGPLMYRWSGQGALLPRDLDRASENCIADTNSRYHKRNAVDFTWSEVRHMIVNTGFEMMEEEMNIPALYTANHDSMMKVLYNSVFLVVKKKC